jgi:hypothetical protein
MAFSPLLSGLSRRGISDTTVAFLALALLAAFHQLVVRERRLAAIPFGAALACLLLTKETALLQLPILLALGLAVTYRRGFVAPAILASAVGASIAAVATAGAILVAVTGGPARLLELVPHLLRSPAANVYVIDHFGGPWYRFAVDAVVLSPLPALLAVGFAFHYLAGKRQSAADELVDFVGLFALFTLGLHMLLALQTSGYALGVRQLLPLEFALCLFAACGLLAFHASAPGRFSRWVPVVGCALAMLQGTVTFQRAFVAHQLYDPNTPATLAALGFLPTGPEDSFACWSRDAVPPPPASLSDDELMKRGFDAIYSKNNGAEAESYLRALLARVPTHYGAMYHLAVALDTCGRIAEARPLWRTVLAIAERTNDQETAKGARDRLAAHDW